MAGQTPPPQGAGATRRILTVCLGNHCRSPLAAAVLARHGDTTVDVRSAGIRDKHVGRPAHPVMIAAARGYDLTGHRGSQVSPDLMQWADIILAMDHANLRALRELADGHTDPKLEGCGRRSRQDRVKFCSCGESGLLGELVEGALVVVGGGA